MTIEALENDCNFFPLIPQPVKEYAEQNGGFLGYVGYFKTFGDDIVLRVFAFRRLKNKPLELREVIRMCPEQEGMVQRDMYLTAMAGWRVCFKPSKRSSESWYGYNYYSVDESDFGHWYWTDKCGIWYKILNYDVVEDTKYKYSGYQEKLHMDPINYWRLWMEEPAVEYFGKAGITPSKTLIQKAKKDRNFITWMRRFGNIDDFRPQAIIYAYNHRMGLNEANDKLYEQNSAIAWARGYFKGSDYGFTTKEMRKIYKYAQESGASASAYRDYLEALRGLRMDLTDTKNIYPKDFRRMHDLRINQWDSKKSAARNKDFKKAVKKYKPYECQGEKFVIIIPNKVEDLKREGRELSHCVGQMGYEKKMIKGDSFIAFLRKAEEPDKPYVTIEYGMKDMKVLQCYGAHDSRPAKEVQDYVKEWGYQTKRKMLKGAANG